MKNLLLGIIFIFFCSILIGQEYGKQIYQDYGSWSIEDGNNTIGVKAYVTREVYINKEENIRYYKYDLVLESISKYNGRQTSTWLYGSRIFINENEVTFKQFPNGFVASINIEPTIIYWHKTNEELDISFYISWDNAIYEPRFN